jgi:leader peptidase (prepilin peptidase)/N-methyltransferase
MILVYLFFFILGTVVGSFLNVVILRLKKNESILKKRSYCPNCKKKLTWYELIPLVSFLIQKGKCRKCEKKISFQYPLVEFFTGLIFLLIAVYYFGFTLYGLINLVYLLVVSCFLIVIFVYDLKYYLVADKIVYSAIIIALLYDIYLTIVSKELWILTTSIAIALSVGGFFLLLVLVSKERWMGMGDVKIGILMGLFFGPFQFLTAFILAFASGALVSIVLLILKKKNLKSEIPFGPFLTGATFITVLWGNYLLNWYFNIFK